VLYINICIYFDVRDLGGLGICTFCAGILMIHKRLRRRGVTARNVGLAEIVGI